MDKQTVPPLYQKMKTQNILILKMILIRGNIEVKACFHLYLASSN